MGSYDSYRARRRFALLAVIQTILLTASLVFSPALAIAQDAEADTAASPGTTETSPAVEEPKAEEPAPAAEAPAAEPDAAPAEEPKAEAPKAEEAASPAKAEEPKEPKAEPQPDPAAKVDEPRAEPDPAPPAEAQEPAAQEDAPQAEAGQDPKAKEPREPKPGKEPAGEAKAEAGAAEAAPAEPERKLIISSEPKTLDLTVGESARLSAWLCSVGEAVGLDEEPGTADDTCVLAKDAAWSVEPVTAASFGKDETAKTRLTAEAAADDAKVIAELGDLADSARLSVAAAPGPEPQVVDEPREPKVDQGAKEEQPAPAEESKLDTEPQGPKADGSKLEEPPAAAGEPSAAADVPAVAEEPLAAAEIPVVAEAPIVAEEQLASEAAQEPAVGPAAAPPSLDACQKGLFFDGPPGIDYFYWLCAGFEGEFNNESTWEGFGFGTCVKPPTSGGNSYTLPDPPSGTEYTLLIIKPGNNQILIPDGDPATQPGPVPGTYYWSLQQGLSHVIYCYRDVDTGTKSGVKFEDLDADGTRDAGESGLVGWTIKVFNDNDDNDILSAGDTLEDTQDTVVGGAYSFSLDPGEYIACEEAQGLPGTWSQSKPSNSICEFDDIDATLAPGGYAFTMTSGGSHVDNDFGNWRPATKSGVKFEDVDADGLPREAGEPGVGGVTINLIDAETKQVVASTLTAADGSYSFGTVMPGVDYLVCESSVAPAWTQSYPGNADCSGVPGMAPGGWAINLASNETDTGNDFGNWRPATKSGVKFHDLDADGVKDAGEPGLSGWTINLVGTAGDGSAVNLSTTTSNGLVDVTGDSVVDPLGTYWFSVKPGSYTVSETLQPGWSQSYPDIPGDGDWDITLTSGQSDSGNDFGNWRPATKSGVKFEDLDADGLPREAGEPGVGGVTIYVDYDNDGVPDAGEPSAITATDGTYSIAGIKPGTWRVKEAAPAGWTCSFPNAGTEAAPVTSTKCYHEEIFVSGAALTGNDFGNWRPASITIEKQTDPDGDPATFEFSGNVAAILGDGGSKSEVVAPGRYASTETVPGGWVLQSIVCSDADSSGDTITGVATFIVTSGESVKCTFTNAKQAGGGSGGGGGPDKDGGGSGGGGGQPPTDTLIPTDTASAATVPFDNTNWILMILLTAAVVLSAGWVIRRVRYSEI